MVLGQAKTILEHLPSIKEKPDMAPGSDDESDDDEDCEQVDEQVAEVMFLAPIFVLLHCLDKGARKPCRQNLR